MQIEKTVADPRVYAFILALVLLLAWPSAARNHAHPEREMRR